MLGPAKLEMLKSVPEVPSRLSGVELVPFPDRRRVLDGVVVRSSGPCRRVSSLSKATL